MVASLSTVLAVAVFASGHAAVLRTTKHERSSLKAYSFAQFVSDFGRNYAAGSQEYASRAAQFQESLDRVNYINAKNVREGRAWWAGVHPFMDWSEAERRSLSGYKPSRKSGAGMAALQTAIGSQSNASWLDFGARDSGASWEGVAIRNQGSCGSCWAISAVEAVEARLPEKTRVAAQALIDCVPNPQHCGGKGGCDGATGELAYSFIRDHGIPLESNYAYTAETGSCPMNPLTGSFPAEKRVRVSGWTTLPSNKAQPLMEALYNQGPVVVAVDANDWFDYDAGVFDGCKKDAELGHAVLAKGYGGDGNTKYWRIQNSWGANWGEQGHIRLKRQDAAEEEAYCGQDRKPQEGLGCDGGPPEITVCGMCGILYDPLYPEGVTIEGGEPDKVAAVPKGVKFDTLEGVTGQAITVSSMGAADIGKEKLAEEAAKSTDALAKAVEDAIWISRDIMVSMGHLALVQRQDEKEAVAAGLQSKMLTSEGVEKHLMCFGLDKETASHTTIQSLSGGQKVKVVLGASMWQDPHLVVLDEPTNYLDRDGLGALTLAIEEFEGGVIIISHNKEFCNAVATEKWIMKAGLLQQEGESVEKAAKEEAGTGNKEEEEVRDAAGNIIDMKKEAKLTDKEKKKEIKDLEKKLKDGKKKKTLTEDEIWEMEDKLAALNKELEESKAAAKGA